MGGMEYLSNLTMAVPSVANIRHYIHIVKERASLRKLIDVCMKISDDCYRGEQDARVIANTAATAILSLALQDDKSTMQHLSTALPQSYEMCIRDRAAADHCDCGACPVVLHEGLPATAYPVLL